MPEFLNQDLPFLLFHQVEFMVYNGFGANWWIWRLPPIGAYKGATFFSMIDPDVTGKVQNGDAWHKLEPREYLDTCKQYSAWRSVQGRTIPERFAYSPGPEPGKMETTTL